MKSGHGANPIFFNKKNKDWTSERLLTPHPPTSDNISFLLLPYPPPPPLKVDVMCVSPLNLILADSWNYMPSILVPSSAKRIATQMLVIAKSNEREDFILRGFVCDIIRPYKNGEIYLLIYLL